MPIYEYQCEDGHLTEEILSIKDYRAFVPCREDQCNKEAQRIWHDTRVERFHQRMAQNPNPVVIHRDKEGNVRFPASADAVVPPGYEKVEMHTLAEIHRFEKEQNTRMRLESEQFSQEEHKQREAMLKERHAELRQDMQRMSPYGRDFARLAMEMSNRRGPRNSDPGFHVEIAHYDQRERGDYRDEKTDWKSRRY